MIGEFETIVQLREIMGVLYVVGGEVSVSLSQYIENAAGVYGSKPNFAGPIRTPSKGLHMVYQVVANRTGGYEIHQITPDFIKLHERLTGYGVVKYIADMYKNNPLCFFELCLDGKEAQEIELGLYANRVPPRLIELTKPKESAHVA